MSTQRMSPADAAWLHMGQPTNLMVVNAMLLLDGPVDRERFKQAIRDRLLARFPRFRQRVLEPSFGVGRPTWEDDPAFDLDLHIHRAALPAPGDVYALRALAGELVVVPLDPAKPLWDMYLLDGYCGSRTALVVRIHHCIADGVALARVLLSLTDEPPGGEASPAAGVASERAPGGADTVVAHALDRAVREGFELVSHPISGTRAAVDVAAANARALAKLLLTGPDADTVLKGTPDVARRLTWCAPVGLADIKSLGHASDTTVNDVVVAAIAGALRDYLAHRESAVAEIRAIVPVNLRPSDEPLGAELGNRFGLVELTLPTGVTGPSHRLAEVHRRMAAIKRSPEAPLYYHLLELGGLTPAGLERRVVDLTSGAESVVITNVPGPSETVYLTGVEVSDIVAWVPTGGTIGIGVSIVSYAGAITVGLQTAASIVPDPERLVSAFAREMHSLLRLRPGARRRAARVQASR
ncbi:MAG: wax ester/triacylglycerol synthase family O-acyltransferase [Solirubrobacteraceae bacterium]